MMKNAVISRRIVKVTRRAVEVEDDPLAIEEPLEVRLVYGPSDKREHQNLTVTMRTPGNDHELVTGLLITEGVIKDYTQIRRIFHADSESFIPNIVQVELDPAVPVDFAALKRNAYTSSSCGVCGKTSIDHLPATAGKLFPDSFMINAAELYKLPGKLRDAQDVFRLTGGLHAVGLFRDGNLVLLREDVGRHNAMDKVIGAAAMENKLPLSNCLALLSGRASFELIAKCAAAAIPLVAAVGAPSSLAVETAHQKGITLAGFIREDCFNIYTHQERIKL